jgi:hypothetical protein
MPWYARLVDGEGTTYAIARQVPGPRGILHEVLSRDDPTTWRPTFEGPAYFTGAGGVTNAEPIDPTTAGTIVASWGGGAA